MKRSTILFLAVLAALLILTGYLGYKAYRLRQQKPEEGQAAEVAVPVHVVQVGTTAIDNILYLTGPVEYANRVDVVAKIPTPGKLIEAKVRQGESVYRDQVIATVSRDDVGLVIDGRPYYMPYKVKAPAAGIIASIVTDRGAMISAQKPVAVIINTEQVKIKASLIEKDLALVKEGASAKIKVDAYADREFFGSVTKIEPVMDAFAHTASVEITVENPDRALFPGMFAHVELVADSHPVAVVVPKEAVFKREGKDLVFKVVQEEKMVAAPVAPAAPGAKPGPVKKVAKKVYRLKLTELKLGYYNLTQYEVLEGLAIGDLVVDRDLAVLKDRTEVMIVNLAEVTPPETLPGATAAPGTTAAAGATAAFGTTAAAGATAVIMPLPGATLTIPGAVLPASTVIPAGTAVLPPATTPGTTPPAETPGATAPASGNTASAFPAIPAPGGSPPPATPGNAPSYPWEAPGSTSGSTAEIVPGATALAPGGTTTPGTTPTFPPNP